MANRGILSGNQTGGYFMTEDAEMVARGKLVTECGKDIQHLATLKSEADSIGKSFEALGSALKSHPGNISVERGEVTIFMSQGQKAIRFTADMLNPERISELVKDISETENRINQAKARIRELGISL